MKNNDYKVYKRRIISNDITTFSIIFTTILGLILTIFIGSEVILLPLCSLLVLISIYILQAVDKSYTHSVIWLCTPCIFTSIFFIYLSKNNVDISINLYCLNLLFVLLPNLNMDIKQTKNIFYSITLNSVIFLLIPSLSQYLNPVKTTPQLEILDNNKIILLVIIFLYLIYIYVLANEITNERSKDAKEINNNLQTIEVFKMSTRLIKKKIKILQKKIIVLESSIKNNKKIEQIEKISWMKGFPFDEKMRSVISILSVAIHAKSAILYKVDHEERITEIAQYAHNKQLTIDKRLPHIKDIVFEKQPKYYNNYSYPLNTITANSGICKPKQHIITPILYSGKVILVLEISLLSEISKHNVDLLNRSLNTIGTYVQIYTIETANTEIKNNLDRINALIEQKRIDIHNYIEKKSMLENKLAEIKKDNDLELNELQKQFHDVIA